jgi:putative transposase
MPGRNIYKDYVTDSYYHIYNRGVNKELIYKDNQDYEVFLGIVKRYLGTAAVSKPNRVSYKSHRGCVELLTYCLMPNHFHLLVFQNENDAMTNFMRSLSVSYSMYFNKKHKRQGPLFQQRYRAVRIDDDSQLLHISRYIHLNPDDYKHYKWSSYEYYTGRKHANWLNLGRILELFEEDYIQFIADYKANRDESKVLEGVLLDD